MICDRCQKEATVYVLDRGKLRLNAAYVKPGQIIPCDDPRTFKKYCDEHSELVLEGK